MRKLVSTIFVFALCTGAFAADLPSRVAPPVYMPVAPPVFTWTGLYIGAQIGYEFGSNLPLAYSPALGPLASTSASENGIIGGAHIGYNYQGPAVPLFGIASTAHLVVGAEGDVDATSARANYMLGGIAGSRSPNVLASARGRLGVATDRTLLYVTGGAAFGDFENRYVNTLNGRSETYAKVHVGYTVGAGIEYALSTNLSVRAEYRFTDFNRTTATLSTTTDGGVTVRQRDTESRVQAGISYKLDMFAPTPVVARY